MNIKDGLKNAIPDEIYLRYRYKKIFGRKLNLSNPQTYNEKLQWLKLHDRKPIYTTMVDKYAAKRYVSNIIGSQYIIPTLGVWTSVDDIDFNELPNQFVLKTTHDSGGIIIVKDKQLFLNNQTLFNISKRKLENSLRRNYYYVGREWPYKDVKPRIIAEQYMQDSSSNSMKDFEFSCFHGIARCLKADFDKFILSQANYFDAKDNIFDFSEIDFPTVSDNMFFLNNTYISQVEQLAKELAQSNNFLNADFYDVKGEKYFGELSFYPASAFQKYASEKTNKLMENWVSINGGLITKVKDIYVRLQYKALNDYKVFTFDGVVDSVMVCTEREKGKPKFRFYDKNWNRLMYNKPEIEPKGDIQRPVNLNELISISEKLGKGHPQLRVDLYDINSKIYFGELTFFNQSGFDTDISFDTDVYWGKKVKLDMNN
ncbi:ATP-grasp fold amidoligase family protein [Galactobacillus timonensis]|uniref:ATP-grasp fold amidoligase family protein n=1 Tax=Galactobacillus timonensis TaxID=2041840 RepID=UPI000C83FA49|nr:ATP-grasp fold amidoligase family protein [Galactobacillus timonensis]